MNLQTAVQTVLSKYADFSGRARRSEYWYWVLAVFILDLVLNVLERVSGVFSILSLLISLALIVPGIAVGTRRLHDTGRSGWWQLLVFTIVGIIVLIVWYAMDSNPGENTYGANPKGLEGGPAGYGIAPGV